MSYICTTCNYSGIFKKTNKGSFLLEIFLWFLYIIPGLIYSIYRRSNRRRQCPNCLNFTIIPTNSPILNK